MKPCLPQETDRVVGVGGKGTPIDLENLVNAMRELAARAAHAGGSDPNLATIAGALADLGRMAAAIGERVLGVENRIGRMAGQHPAAEQAGRLTVTPPGK